MSRRRALVATALLFIAPMTARPDSHRPLVATFSIVAWDEETGDLGVAVESRFFAVGSVVPWAKAGVGAIATQSFANTTFGPAGLKLLEQGLSAQETLDRLVKDDPQADQRQVGIVDAEGQVRPGRGGSATPSPGDRRGKTTRPRGTSSPERKWCRRLHPRSRPRRGFPWQIAW